MICVLVRGGNWVGYRKWKNKFGLCRVIHDIERARPGSVSGGISQPVLSVCAGVAHLFIYFESNCKLVPKMKSIWCQPKGDLNTAVFMLVTWTVNTLKGSISLDDVQKLLFSPHSAHVITSYYIHLSSYNYIPEAKRFSWTSMCSKQCLLLAADGG